MSRIASFSDGCWIISSAFKIIIVVSFKQNAAVIVVVRGVELTSVEKDKNL